MLTRKISLLKAVLRLPEDEYASIEITGPLLLPEYVDDKYSIIDVKLHTKSKWAIHIEIQLKVTPACIKDSHAQFALPQSPCTLILDRPERDYSNYTVRNTFPKAVLHMPNDEAAKRRFEKIMCDFYTSQIEKRLQSLYLKSRSRSSWKH